MCTEGEYCIHHHRTVHVLIAGEMIPFPFPISSWHCEGLCGCRRCNSSDHQSLTAQNVVTFLEATTLDLCCFCVTFGMGMIYGSLIHRFLCIVYRAKLAKFQHSMSHISVNRCINWTCIFGQHMNARHTGVPASHDQKSVVAKEAFLLHQSSPISRDGQTRWQDSAFMPTVHELLRCSLEIALKILRSGVQTGKAVS